MNRSMTLRSTLLAVLALGAAGAMAGPMTLTTTPLTLPTTGAFTFHSTLHLDSRQEVRLQLQGWSANATDLQIAQLRLTNGAQTLVFDAVADGTALGAPALSQSTMGAGRGAFTAYLQDFSLGPVVLDAGDWSVDVLGTDDHVKFASGLRLSAQAGAVVPEPAGFALALTALGGALLARRRRAR